MNRMKFPSFPRLLLVIFLATLPFVNPWVRGDGVNYYAYVRSLLVQHDLSFEADWRHANLSFRMWSVNPEGQIAPEFYTSTGHVKNDYAVGASMLWAPFLVPVHAAMLVLQRLGFNVKADGFSKPYVLTMALATALYAFVGLWLSFQFTCSYVPERWAFLATLGHVVCKLSAHLHVFHSFLFARALGVCSRTLPLVLEPDPPPAIRGSVGHSRPSFGPVAGYLLLEYRDSPLASPRIIAGLLEKLADSPGIIWKAPRRLFLANLAYAGAIVFAFSPTLIMRTIINGHPLALGYDNLGFSHWIHPALWQPLVSSDHGLITWTPIVIPAIVGLVLLRKYDRDLAVYSLTAIGALYYIVACHNDWHAGSSFGNRFFLSLTPFFILGLAVTLQEAAAWFKKQNTAYAVMATAIGVLTLWNLAFIFQWGTGLVPHRGPISWKQMAYNQVAVVPAKLGSDLKAYFTHRGGMMQSIEMDDVRHMRNE